MDDFGIIILAGGKSSRMGEDKGLMTLFGKPMVSYILETARKLTDDIIIVSNNSNYKQFGHPLFKDLIRDKGPLTGIYTGLKKCEKDYNLILSCDIPYVKEGLLKYILYQSEGFDITVPTHNERVHPLMGVYHKNCLDHFKKCLDYNSLRITDSFDYLHTNIIQTDEFDDVEFKNLNSKKDIIPL